MAAMAEPTYTIDVAYGKSVKARHTTLNSVDTGAGVNVIDSALILPEWGNSFKKESIPRL